MRIVVLLVVVALASACGDKDDGGGGYSAAGTAECLAGQDGFIPPEPGGESTLIEHAGFSTSGPDRLDDLAEHDDDVQVAGDFLMVHWWDDDAEGRTKVQLSFADDPEGAKALHELDGVNARNEVRGNVFLQWDAGATDDDRELITGCLEEAQ